MLLAGVAVFVLIYILNSLYPLYADDWNYSFVHGETATRIQSFSDIFTSQYNHYMTWGGRSVVHFIAETMLMTGFFWCCILNSLAFVFFVYVMYMIANRGNRPNPVLFFLFSLLIWFAQPAFFATILWKTGAANYLWGTLIILLFLYSYYAYYRSRKTNNSVPKAILFFLFGIIVLLLMPVGIMLANIDFKANYLKVSYVIFFVALLVIYGFQYKTVYDNLTYVTSFWTEREAYIAEQKQQGKIDIVFSKKFELPKEYYISDLSDDPEYWENGCYSRFYKIQSVRLIIPDSTK